MREESYDRLAPDIEYIAYFEGKAIARDEWGELYYQEIPEEFVTFGEIAFFEDIEPISALPQEDQQRIREYLEME